MTRRHAPRNSDEHLQLRIHRDARRRRVALHGLADSAGAPITQTLSVRVTEGAAVVWEVRVRDAAEARDALVWMCAAADAAVFHVRLVSPPDSIVAAPSRPLPPQRAAEAFPRRAQSA